MVALFILTKLYFRFFKPIKLDMCKGIIIWFLFEINLFFLLKILELLNFILGDGKKTYFPFFKSIFNPKSLDNFFSISGFNLFKVYNVGIDKYTKNRRSYISEYY